MITKGLWTVEQGGCYIVGGGHEIATMFPGHGDDARLIAAAPEMLEIVRTVVNLGLLEHHDERAAARALLVRIRGGA